MTSNSKDYTPQQYRKYNGQSVLKALRSIGNEASANDMAQFIAEEIGETTKRVLPEVKQVLRRGIIDGFLVRTGMTYSLAGDNIDVQVDSAPRRKRRYNEVDGPKHRVYSPIRLSKRRKSTNYDEEDNEEEEGKEEDDEEQEMSDAEDNFQVNVKAPRVRLYEPLQDSEPESEPEHEEEDILEDSSSEDDESLQRPFIEFKRRNTNRKTKI